MSRGLRAGAVLLPLLVLVLQGGAGCGGARGGADAAPVFGALFLNSLLGGSELASNGTSALGLAALAHVQHKLDALGQLADLLALSGNLTQSFLV